jgi:hypothetical protein
MAGGRAIGIADRTTAVGAMAGGEKWTQNDSTVHRRIRRDRVDRAGVGRVAVGRVDDRWGRRRVKGVSGVHRRRTKVGRRVMGDRRPRIGGARSRFDRWGRHVGRTAKVS